MTKLELTLTRLGVTAEIADERALASAARRMRELGLRLPTFAELAEPERLPASASRGLADVDPDLPHALNLTRVHWYNGPDRRERVALPGHLLLGPELTGVEAPIALLLGDRFPMIGAHKVLAAYACLAPRLATGRFDPTRQRAVWPSTGNYCRGGVAISRLLGCRGVAVLPEGMSTERFRWLERWVASPEDVIRTPGTESNVKEIYDECERLERDPEVVILNQFRELANHLVHRACTGRAAERVWQALRETRPRLRPFAFVAATGSAGTLGAGHHLAERHGTRVLAAEALECPTLLYNGYGEHNIQGIGDKHVPLIHDVLGTDYVAAVSDQSTDRLLALFASEAGRAFLAQERGVDRCTLECLEHLGLSSLCNLLAAIQLAKRERLGPDDLVLTVATDGAALYESEREKILARDFPRGLDGASAARTFEERVLGADDEHLLALGPKERARVFNLGYFTWVEQRGVSLEDFEARRSREFWEALPPFLALWDERIAELNRAAGTA